MTPSARALSADGKRVVAALALALLLLSTSCLKKAAPPVTQSKISHFMSSSRAGVIGGQDFDKFPDFVSVALASSDQPGALDTRRIISNGALDLLVNDVGQSIEKINSIVTSEGGFVEKSTRTNSGGHSASVTVRVPAAHLDRVVSQVKSLATSVDRESVEVRDVTREYIDLDARLRNAQAEETQYLQILKRAATIKDTLDVTEKLTDVRGRIEQLQREMKFLTSQIEMSSLEISLRAEADENVAGFHWRPLRQARIALGEMVSRLADWADSVIAFFINLPLIAVWLVSVVVLLIVIVRIVRFLWRRLVPKTGWRLPWRRSTPESAGGSPPAP